MRAATLDLGALRLSLADVADALPCLEALDVSGGGGSWCEGAASSRQSGDERRSGNGDSSSSSSSSNEGGIMVEAAGATLQLAPLQALSARGPSRLRVLNVEACALTSLGGAGALPLLEELRAARNRVADLAPLQGLQRMRVLDLAGNAICDLDMLVYLSDCPALRDLRLAGNPLAAGAAARRARGMLAQVEWLDGAALRIPRAASPAGDDADGEPAVQAPLQAEQPAPPPPALRQQLPQQQLQQLSQQLPQPRPPPLPLPRPLSGRGAQLSICSSSNTSSSDLSSLMLSPRLSLSGSVRSSSSGAGGYGVSGRLRPLSSCESVLSIACTPRTARAGVLVGAPPALQPLTRPATAGAGGQSALAAASMRCAAVDSQFSSSGHARPKTAGCGLGAGAPAVRSSGSSALIPTLARRRPDSDSSRSGNHL